MRYEIVHGDKAHLAGGAQLAGAVRSFPLGLMAFVLFVLIGCASSEPVTVRYDDSGDLTTFETRPLDAGIDLSGDALGSGQRVLFQVRARCRGQGCTPREAALSFFLTGGSSPVYLADRSVTIRAGGARYHWAQRRRLDVGESASIVSEIVEVSLDLEALETIAEGETVTGTVGSKAFEWSYELREPLRMLVRRMKG